MMRCEKQISVYIRTITAFCLAQNVMLIDSIFAGKYPSLFLPLFSFYLLLLLLLLLAGRESGTFVLFLRGKRVKRTLSDEHVSFFFLFFLIKRVRYSFFNDL